jgi:hypothetical protein
VNLFRLFGYAVVPQRTVPVSQRTAPVGSAIDVDVELRQALDVALQDARRSRMTRVSLKLDTNPSSRTSPVRDAVMTVAFARRASEGQPGAQALADRVSIAMDRRSEDSLFLVAVYRESASGPKRDVALWVFPRGRAFQFDPAHRRIRPVADLFDQRSVWRKLAFFSGKNLRGQFIDANVLDLQAGAAHDVTELWSERFLDAGLTITADAGTRMLAQAFSKTSTLDLPYTAREQLNAAVMALRQTPVQRWNVRAVANQFLSDDLAEKFVAQVPNDESRQSQFALDKELFGRTLHFRVFRLEGDVYVSSPLDQIGAGKPVTVETADDAAVQPGFGERVLVDGTVVEDKLKQRRM